MALPIIRCSRSLSTSSAERSKLRRTSERGGLDAEVPLGPSGDIRAAIKLLA